MRWLVYLCTFLTVAVIGAGLIAFSPVIGTELLILYNVKHTKLVKLVYTPDECKLTYY